MTTSVTLPLDLTVFDDRFAVRHDRVLTRLWTGGRWLEGPVHVPTARMLIFSDIPNDRVLRYDEVTGEVTTFAAPAGFANGHRLDSCGRLLTCEHGARRVTRTEPDGSVTILADAIDGSRLNSPNDVTTSPDGAIWFTDPSYGILDHHEGHAASSEIGSNDVYRIAPNGTPTRAIDSLTAPNGIAFSPDASVLYVTDSETDTLHAFDHDHGRLTNARTLATSTDGTFDGFRVDDAGRIWTSAGAGVDVYDADGTRLARIGLPETVSNVAFGGSRRTDLHITATTSLYVIKVGARGLWPG
ncbi:gluconolactonase [Naumannella cuiyingiana]|uniref:Gluconolactonase n=1 Tax=Naumannella cuiyingiana TaxID=1347891 RepID=A0A7Z0D6I4_9ACTN|nr:SMP-30/gluconolactonase/LRE family protein [Naumannella cuiyingiana]NYI69820.1 gluconolactonase [Naumannella cuiyingiana]